MILPPPRFPCPKKVIRGHFKSWAVVLQAVWSRPEFYLWKMPCPKPSAPKDITGVFLHSPLCSPYITGLCILLERNLNKEFLIRVHAERPLSFSITSLPMPVITGAAVGNNSNLCRSSRNLRASGAVRLPNTELPKKRVDSLAKVHITPNPLENQMLRIILWKSTWAMFSSNFL